MAGLPPQVTCHELCHLLGLGNCRWLGCIMQGALSLEEALRRPLDLCPICLRKLQHVLGFKLIDRYKVSGSEGGPPGQGLQQASAWSGSPRGSPRAEDSGVRGVRTPGEQTDPRVCTFLLCWAACGA